MIRNRYSCKKFDDRAVPAEQLNAILEAGRVTPTAKNLQEQRIYVVQSEEGLAKIDKVTAYRYGTPTAVVVVFDRNHVFTYPSGRHGSGAEDAAIVATHTMLAAEGDGASCAAHTAKGTFGDRDLYLEIEKVKMKNTFVACFSASGVTTRVTGTLDFT